MLNIRHTFLSKSKNDSNQNYTRNKEHNFLTQFITPSHMEFFFCLVAILVPDLNPSRAGNSQSEVLISQSEFQFHFSGFSKLTVATKQSTPNMVWKTESQKGAFSCVCRYNKK